MQSADELIKSYHNYPVPSEKLRKAMVWIAELLCDEPLEAQDGTTLWSVRTLKPSVCRAICEHLAKARVVLICEDCFLPGQFQLHPGEGLAEWWRKNTAEIKPEMESGGETAKEKRTGRRRKGEQSDDPLIVAALAHHHGYEQGGSVGNYDPVTGKALAALANVNEMAVSRFMKKQFGSPGHRGYKAACNGETIGHRLAGWQKELPEGTEEFLTELYDRREEK